MFDFEKKYQVEHGKHSGAFRANKQNVSLYLFFILFVNHIFLWLFINNIHFKSNKEVNESKKLIKSITPCSTKVIAFWSSKRI